MGKKSKMIIQDPILKKNFKYEKRKKQRQLQKQKIKQQQQAQQKRMQQLKLIEKKVQQDIQKYYEQEKIKLINQNNKTKNIHKNNLLNAFKNKQSSTINPLANSESNKKYQEQFIKNLPSYQIKQAQNAYQTHFKSQLPKFVTDVLTKQKKITQSMKMQQQIKKQIKSMFSVKKVGQQEQTQNERIRNILKNKNTQHIFGNSQLQQALQKQQTIQQPYVIDKVVKSESQILIDNKIFSFNKLALQNKNLLKINGHNKNQMIQQEQQQSQYLTAHQIVSNYIDYIHVENKQQQTIQQFRQVVINHMYQHQLQCFKALKMNQKAKGFTNAKFLIISPYVGDAKAIFDIIEQTFMKDQQNTQQIIQDLSNNQKKKKKRQLQWVIQNKQKIQLNQDDQDDFFRVGIKILPKKKKVVYFSNFDSSDIIVASPIGLKSIINGQSGKKQISFLSSVQILYIDRASVIMMQNWDHLLDIFQNLNYMPKYQSLKNSINQIRQQFLQLKGRVYRQNIVFTEFTFPQLNSLKINHFHNWQGCATIKPIFRPMVLEQNSKIQKNFNKIQLKQPKDDLETRFQYFKRKFWDKLHNNDQIKKVVLFVNSYFQFVKLKGFLQKVNASFQAISEHTKKQKIQSRVSLFNNNNYRILLLTQRAYYFGLCQIKKHQHLYFYSLPKNAFIYKDLIQNMKQQTNEDNKIVCIYSKYDKFIIERLVGSLKAIEMVKQYCTNVNFIV